MKLLTITDEDHLEKLEDYFETHDQTTMDKIAPEVVNSKADVKIEGRPIDEYDCIYAEIPKKNAVFGRVMLEMVEEKGIRTNYSSTSFFIMAKKNYLYYILHEQQIPTPKTVTLADEKAGRNIERELDYPLVGRRIENLEPHESQKLENEEELKTFLDGIEYDDEVIILQEHEETEKYRCLVAGEQIISVKEDDDNWKFSEKNLKYSTISDNQKKIVTNVVKKIGTNVAEVLLKGQKVYDVNPNPNLEMYMNISGKDSFNAVAEAIKED